MDESSEGAVHHCDSNDVHSMMQKLFDEGHDSVEIQVDGQSKVITKADFNAMKDAKSGAKKLSPAKKLMKQKQFDRIVTQKQIRHRTAMITAKVHVIDVEEGNFGFDAEGNEIDVDGLVFTPTEHYLNGVDLKPNEFGAFIDEDGIKPPIRLVKKV